MEILSMKPGHDGHLCYISGRKLVFSIEAEKDSYPRLDPIHPELLLKAFERVPQIPDVIAVSGWVKELEPHPLSVKAGYLGVSDETKKVHTIKVFGRDVSFFSDTHERSHIMASYGLSPFAQGEPCYALTYEGTIGDFYFVDEDINIKRLGQPLSAPGLIYSFPFLIADPAFPDFGGSNKFDGAGKVMALAAYSKRSPLTKEESKFIEKIFEWGPVVEGDKKGKHKEAPFYNRGPESEEFKEMAGKISDAIFERFYSFAKQHLKEKLPLIISGGCGLNCEWNRRWEESGLFSQVFVPPVTNDSGVAIGAGIDAQHHFGGGAKLEWDVYAGLPFEETHPIDSGLFEEQPMSYQLVAELLAQSKILGWVQGNFEIGPRALGNRSIIAQPFDKHILERLNRIKKRESYRPIAPMCLEEDLGRHFDSAIPRPHMLFFQHVTDERLQAITHYDGTARVQSVNAGQNQKMYELLSAFKQRSGVGVLCNTSLNFKGKGFINNSGDLERYAFENGLDGFVINDRLYLKKS